MKGSNNSLVAQLADMVAQRDALERQIAVVQKEAEAIIEISNKVKALAKESNVSLLDIAYALVPDLAKGTRTTEVAVPGRSRPVKIYRNPENGEVIETKGGNHTKLKEWKAKYGSSVVEGWREDDGAK